MTAEFSFMDVADESLEKVAGSQVSVAMGKGAGGCRGLQPVWVDF